MYPILLQVGNFFLPSWHAFYLLGGVSAWWLMHHLRPKLFVELESRILDQLFIGTYLAAYVGARGFSIWLEQEYRQADFSWLRTPLQMGSMTLYGGVLAAAAFVIVFAVRRKISLTRCADLTLPPTIFAIGLGRIGCFLNGDDYGKALLSENPPWWAVSFPHLQDNVYRYPVQLMETAYCWILFTAIYYHIQRTSSRTGAIADMGIVGYAGGRFVLEFWRGDERGVLFNPVLSPAQWISVLLLATWIIFRILSKQGKVNQAQQR